MKLELHVLDTKIKTGVVRFTFSAKCNPHVLARLDESPTDMPYYEETVVCYYIFNHIASQLSINAAPVVTTRYSAQKTSFVISFETQAASITNFSSVIRTAAGAIKSKCNTYSKCMRGHNRHFNASEAAYNSVIRGVRDMHIEMFAKASKGLRPEKIRKLSEAIKDKFADLNGSGSASSGSATISVPEDCVEINARGAPGVILYHFISQFERSTYCSDGKIYVPRIFISVLKSKLTPAVVSRILRKMEKEGNLKDVINYRNARNAYMTGEIAGQSMSAIDDAIGKIYLSL